MLGFKQLLPTDEYSRLKTPASPIFKIYPSALNHARFAMLFSDQGCGVELVEMADPATRPDQLYSFERDMTRGGFYHVGVRTDDVRGLAERIVAHGGRMLDKVTTLFDRYHVVYTQDKWGNLIELMDFTMLELAEASKAESGQLML